MASSPGGSLVCPACGAGVSKADVACRYCGAEIVLPKPRGTEDPAERRTYCTRCGTLYPADAAKCPRCPTFDTDPRGGKCPRCAGDLEPISIGGVTVDRCRACRGHWFDGDEIEHALDVTTKGVSREEGAAMRAALPEWRQPLEEIRYLACVRCGERMARRQVAPRAGVIVDVCRNHGVWFDGGEMEQFAAFAKAGGLEVLRLDGIAAAEMRRKAAQARTHADDVWVSRPTGPYDESFLTVDVTRAVGRLFRHLFR
jgi:Zn-finger nucleic acid-binding protein